MAGNKYGFYWGLLFHPFKWSDMGWYRARLEPVEIVKHQKDWSLKNLANVHIEV